MAMQTQDRYLPEAGDPIRGGTTVDRQTLIEALNGDLAREYQAILMYIQYSAKLTGPYRDTLRALFQNEIPDEQGHAQMLADKIAYYGGDPTTEAAPVPRADTPREMLENVLEAEKTAIVEYNERIHQAEAFGDVGLRTQLENQVQDETKHMEEVDLFLRGWDGFSQ